MKFTLINPPLVGINYLKLVGYALFFVFLSSSFLQAGTIVVPSEEKLTLSQKNNNTFEITSAFISSWEVKEIRDHVVLEILSTNDFLQAHTIIEELRKIINEPIIVKHGFENDKIVYTIIVGRFTNVDEAVSYHNMLR